MALVYPHYLADPFVWKVGEDYFAVGTDASNNSHVDKEGVFPLLISKNLTNWTYVRHVLPKLDPGYGDSYWAPEVAEHEGRFYMYYSVGFSDKLHQIRVAVSSEAAGPYEDVQTPLLDPFKCSFAIDAHPFKDGENWYLFYARDFLDQERGSRAGTGLVVDRMTSMLSLAGEEQVVFRPNKDWQLFKAKRVMYGRRFDWHTLEGPCVHKANGKYYCLFSGGCWENETYGVDFVSATSPMGPYSDENSLARPRVLQTSKALRGPGHVSLIKREGIKENYIVYHAWNSDMTERQMHISPIDWTEDGPKVRRLEGHPA